MTKINPMDIKKFTALGGLKEIALKELNITTIPKIFEKMKNLISLKLSTFATMQARIKLDASKIYNVCLS